MISVCIITKNEQKHLEQCLKRLVPTGCEIVVVDTGSTDKSVEIARKYTQSVYFFEWCDDFSAARNYSIEKASNDYVLCLDTDEYLEEYDSMEINNLITLNPDKIGCIQIRNDYMNNGNVMINYDYISRFFDRRIYHFEGSIHEQIVDYSGNGNHEKYLLPIKIHHYGYMENEHDRKKKSERNIKLLLKELERDKGNPYILYQIGKSFYYTEDYKSALEYFEQAVSLDLDLKLEYVKDLVVIYGYSLMNTDNNKKAEQLQALYEDYCDYADYLFMMALVFMKNAKFDISVDLFFQATKCEKFSVEGVNSYLAFYNIGVIFECLGDKKTALSYYSKCGNYKQAADGIKRCSM